MKQLFKLTLSILLGLSLSTEAQATDLIGTSGNTILTLAGSPYNLTGTFTVELGNTVTIEPGVVINFNSYNRDFFVEGTLIAQGTSANPIRFVSPVANGGGSLVFSASSVGFLSYVEFEDLGRFGSSGYDTGLYLESTSVTADNLSFDNCGSLAGTISITADADALNGFGGNNSLNRVSIIAGTLDMASTFPKLSQSEFSYYLPNGLTVPVGASLTLSPGIKVEMPSYNRDLNVDGELVAEGSAADSIIFFSEAANGGGSIALRTNCVASLDYVSFKNLGFFTSSFYDTGLYIEECTYSADNMRFDNCGYQSGTINVIADADMVVNIGPNNSLDQIELINSSLDGTSTWPQVDASGFNYRMAGDITVASGHTLTIEAGVDIEVSNYNIDLVVSPGAEIIMLGTAVDGIRLYSNPTLGGGSLALQAGATGTLQYVEFENLGVFSSSHYDTGLHCDDADLTADYLTFINCGVNGKRSMQAWPDRLNNLGVHNELDQILLTARALDQNSLWPMADPAGFTYVLANTISAPAGITLTIAAGDSIDITHYGHDIEIAGELIAQGTSANPISIFSNTALGGGSLALLDGAVAELEFVKFDNLGYFSSSAYDAGLYVMDAQVTADNLEFFECGVDRKRSIDAQPDRLSGFGANNQVDIVRLRNWTIDESVTWPNMDMSGFNYQLADDIAVAQGSALLIEPGCSVEFPYYTRDLIIHGTLTAIGTAEDSISFYSNASIGGGSIALLNGSVANEIQYCNIDSLGYFSGTAYDAGVYIDNAEVSIQKSVITGSRYGVYFENGLGEVRNNIIKNNTVLGLYNAPANVQVIACDNYWGDPSGPYNATDNPTGLGNGVSDNVMAANCYVGPLVIVCPADTNVYVGDDYSELELGTVELCIRDCGESSYSYTDDIIDPQCSGLVQRTFSVMDTCGNNVTCIQALSFMDTISPSISCPSDVVLACNETPVPVDANLLEVDDNCQVASVVLSSTQESGDGCMHYYDYEYTVLDPSGNSASCSYSLEVMIDEQSPVLAGMPTDITVDCDSYPLAAELTVVDNCDSDVSIVLEEYSPENPCELMLTRTWSATDACGNEASYTQTITGDRGDLVFQNAPADITVECSDLPITAPAVTASDLCGEATIAFVEQDNADCSGTITRSWTATDMCGNSDAWTQVITVVDTTAPVISDYSDMTLACEDVVPAASVTVSDNCSEASYTVAESTEETCGDAYILTRTYTATDACGNTAIAVQTITVEDNSDPVLVGVPADITVSCSAIPLPANVTATDDCGAATVILDEEGTCPGNIIRTWQATDACGNTSVFASQVITAIEDTPMELTGVPADMTLECDETIPSPPLVTATGPCGTPSVTFEETTEDLACGSTITRTWTALDECENQTMVSQVITIVDTTSPVISAYPNMTLECGAAIPAPSVSVVDNCSEAGYTVEETIEDTCGETYIITRTYTATDVCGNSSVAVQTITIIDTFAPVLVGVPADITVSCSAIPVPANVTATDACGMATVVLDEEGSCPGNIIRTWQATDACGNTSVFASQVITAIEDTPMELTGVPADVTLECDEIVPSPAVVTATGPCGAPMVIFEETTEDLACGSTITRTWTALDECENQAMASQVITITDTTAPLITVGEDITVECGEEIPAPQATVVDNCDLDLSWTYTESYEASCGNTGVYERVYFASDACGNTATVTQYINIVDSTDPVIVCPEGIVLEGDAFCQTALPDFTTQVLVSDECSDVTLTQTPPAGTLISASQLVSVFALDDCGNATSCEFTVLVSNAADLSYSSEGYCLEQDAVFPILVGPEGGLYTSDTFGLALNNETGQITPENSMPGVYQVSYSYEGSCMVDLTVEVTIYEEESAELTYPEGPFCPTDGDIPATLNGDAGGVFAGTVGLVLDSATGTIDIASSTPGLHTVSYTTPGPCPVSSNFDIVIQTTAQCEGEPNTECEDALEVAVTVFGDGGWQMHNSDSEASMPACIGDANDDRWFHFTAQSANDIVISQGLSVGADMAIEIYTACGGELIGCYNNYGPRAVEFASPGTLIPGASYRFRTYDVGSALVDAPIRVNVKTFEDGGLQAPYCGVMDYQLSESVYAERDDQGQLYQNPNIYVAQYQFRFIDTETGAEYIANHPNYTSYITLANVAGLVYDKQYEVSVRHSVLMNANGQVSFRWSEFGTPCTIGLQEDVPQTKLRDEFCSELDLELDDLVQADLVQGADYYRFTFQGGGETFVETVPSYGLFLYTVGEGDTGLQYGVVYTVTVQANVGGIWSEAGEPCVVGMAPQSSSVELLEQYCGADIVWPDPNYILADYAYGATQYEFRFTHVDESIAPFTELTDGISLAFHLTSSEFVAGDYMVDVKAKAGGQWGDFGNACLVSVNGFDDLEVTQTNEGESAMKSLDVSPFELTVYPNPNDGSEFNVNISGLHVSQGLIQVEVYTLQGVLVDTQQVPYKGSQHLIAMQPSTQLSAGLYMLRVSTAGAHQEMRLVVR